MKTPTATATPKTAVSASIAIAIRTLLCLAALATGTAAAAPQDERSAEREPPTVAFDTPITYAAGNRLYVDAGTEDGLAVGMEATVRRGGSDIARVRVGSVSRSSASLEIVRRIGGDPPRIGDEVRFRIEKPRAAARTPAEGERDERADGTAGSGGRDDGFVPLLAPTEPVAARTSERNVFHGWIELGGGANLSDVEDRDETRLSLTTGGSLERIGGAPWSLEWDVDTYTRGGDDADDPTEGRIEIDRLVLRRHFDGDGVVGIGRVQPLALPSIARVDGLYGEWRAGPGLRLGLVGGTRPDLEDQGFSSDEIAVAPYAVFEVGDREEVRFWTSTGFLATWFEGEADRRALLWDARLDLLRRYSLRVTSEVDFYDGDDVDRDGARLTRLGAYASAELHSLLEPWVDVRDIELPDTLARREREGLAPDDPVAEGYRRSRVGVRHDFGQGWSLQESFAWLDSDEVDDTSFEVRGAKTGIFGLPGSRADVAVYEIVGVDSDGLGLSAGLSARPVESLWMRLGYIHSEIDADTAGSPSFSTKTATIDLDWFLSRDWSLAARLAHSFGEEDDASILDVALTWRW